MLQELSQKKNILHSIILVNLLIRLFIVSFTNLGNDEVYYVLYALYPDWSYFDHPPMLAYLLRLTTLDGYFTADFFIRLGPLLLGTINLYLIYGIGKLIRNHKTGILSTILLSASLYGTILTGTFILPDTPQSTCWLFALYWLIPYFKGDQKAWRWLAFGLAAGLGLLSKYHAVYLWGGLGLFLLKYRQKELLNPWVYVSGVLSIAIFAPVLFWNYTSPYSGFNYHANRVGGSSILPSFDHFFPEFFGQIFYNNPFNIFLIVTGLFYLFKKRNAIIGIDLKLLLFMSFPLVFTTLGMALYNKTLPHWSGPSYFAFILLAAFAYAEKEEKKPTQTLKKALIGGHVFLLAIVLLAFVQMKTAWVPLSSEKAPERIGKGDFTVDLSAWNAIGGLLESAVDSLSEVGAIDENTYLLTHNWFPGAHIDKYYAIPNKRNLYVFGAPDRQHHYMFIHPLRGQPVLNSDALYISTSNYLAEPDQNLKKLFLSVDAPIILPVYRNGRLLVNVFIWKMNKQQAPLPFEG